MIGNNVNCDTVKHSFMSNYTSEREVSKRKRVAHLQGFAKVAHFQVGVETHEYKYESCSLSYIHTMRSTIATTLMLESGILTEPST